MAGLFAWAADVVGGGGQSNDEDDINAIPVAFTPEQQQYARQLDLKASSLNRSIQDLRLRLPPPDISQRLPHLHAHSLASNAALALQLNAHSTTKEQAQLREVTLQEENAAYEKAISNCDNKIHEKLKEADLFRTKLQEMDLTEKNLKDKLENALAAFHARQSGKLGELSIDSETTVEAQDVIEASKSDVLDKLENKKQELSLMEEMVEVLEKKWAQVQENALKQPSPAQREKILDRQLHSLIEQLATKQAQAEGLVSEIHLKEMELERLNGLWRSLETSTAEVNAARNRFGRSNSEKGSLSSDYIVDPHHRPSYHLGGRTENLMLLRSAFVLYILALHILVFIRISF
ncbi:hypothetical protein CsSME_00004014 [Camellia sinensis var. sinensis]